MEVRKEYALLFNSVTETIEQLSKIIFTASSCLELLKKVQLDTEEMFSQESGNDGETETDN